MTTTLELDQRMSDRARETTDFPSIDAMRGDDVGVAEGGFLSDAALDDIAWLASDERMMPPGHILHFEHPLGPDVRTSEGHAERTRACCQSDDVQRPDHGLVHHPRWARAEDFQDIIISANALTAHLPDVTDRIIKEAVVSVLA
jgi:hypothetical protein